MVFDKNMKMSEFRNLIETKIKETAAKNDLVIFDTTKPFGKYAIEDSGKILQTIKDCDSVFSLAKAPISRIFITKKSESEMFDYFCNMTFDKIANKICQSIVNLRVANAKLQNSVRQYEN